MDGSPSTAPVALQMRGVSFGSMNDQSRVVARDVDWTVRAGDYWVVGGLQGTGKTDFLMLAGGLMPLLSGRYELFGEPMPIFEDYRIRDRLRLGVVFEEGQLFNQLTVWENIALPCQYHHDLSPADALAEVRPLLELTELGPWADSTPGTLGRNWQKRVGLARALALHPEVLLLDNPLGGLDVRHAGWWLNFLDQLSLGQPLPGGRPVTLVTTAADLRPWRGRARQLAVLKDEHLLVMGDWNRLESTDAGAVSELLVAEPVAGQGEGR